MARLSYYLLALLLAFIASLLWISWGLNASIPVLTLSYGSCSCPPLTKATVAIPDSSHPIYQPSPKLEHTAPVADEVFTNSAASALPPIKTKDQLDSSLFPAKLWQKAGPNGVDDARREDIKSWQQQTPNLRHEILTDGSGSQYVREQYANFPDLLNLFLSLQVPILKADLLRQLILYTDGGIWSDLDVTCHAPIDTWIPEPYRNKTNLVVGLEFDGAQFASWTVMAKPRTSHIAAVLRYVVSQLEKSAVDYNTTISGLTMQTISDVVDVTGPQAMTVAILRSLEKEMGVPVGRPNITDLHEPLLLQDVLILPNAAFAALQAGWPEDRGPYLVEHHYAGSWKNDKGGEDAI